MWDRHPYRSVMANWWMVGGDLRWLKFCVVFCEGSTGVLVFF